MLNVVYGGPNFAPNAVGLQAPPAALGPQRRNTNTEQLGRVLQRHRPVLLFY
jgi:hypothetical protein